MKKGGMILLSIGVMAMGAIVGVALWKQEVRNGAENSTAAPTIFANAEEETVRASALKQTQPDREAQKPASIPPADASSIPELPATAPTVLNFTTEKILPVGATSVDLSFWIQDENGDADALMIETTEFFYKTGKTNVYSPEFRAIADISGLTCTGETLMSCVYHATFVGALGWRDVFSGRIQARDAGGRVSKTIPFHIAIGTVN